MEGLIDLILICLLLTNLVLLGSSRLLLCIRALAVQGILLSLLPFLFLLKKQYPKNHINTGATQNVNGKMFYFQ